MMTNITFNNASNKKSPFAIYPAERLNIMNEVTRNDIMLMSDLDQLVMVAINEMLLTTCHILHKHLLQLGLKKVEIDEIRTSLAKLSSAGYLTKMEFVSSIGSSYHKVYTLSSKGQIFIRSKGKHPMLSGYIEGLQAAAIKRLLSATQFIVSQNYVSKASSISIAAVVAERGSCDANENGHIFRPNAIVQFSDKTVFVESVRRTNNNEQELIRKLKRIDDCLKHSKYLNITVHEPIEVIVVCEDAAHMYSVMSAVESSKFRGCFKMVFTNDMDVFHKPDACLCSYEPVKTVWEKALDAVTRLVS